MPNEETLKKITGKIIGDPGDEAFEAQYRAIARIAAHQVWMQGINLIRANNASKTKAKWYDPRTWHLGRIDRLRTDNAIKIIQEYQQAGEAVTSFVLAAILEFVSIPILTEDRRKRLAYNLRVRFYEEIEVGFETRVLDVLIETLVQAFKKTGKDFISTGDSKSDDKASSKAAETTDDSSPANVTG